MFNGASIIGPAIAGVLVAAIGEGWCFFANGVSYIAVIVGLLLMRVEATADRVQPQSTFDHIAEGFRYVAHTAPIRALLGLLGIVSFAGRPYSVLMPIFAGHILHAGARGLGLLMGASGVGALAGALTLAARSGTRGLGRWAAYGCGGFAVSLIVFSWSRTFWLSAALIVPAGFGIMVQMASCNTLIQSMVEDRLRGRVMAVYSMMFMGMGPVGALAAGATADRFGAPLAVTAGGVICLMAALFFRWKLPGLRAESRQLIQAQLDTIQ
jgi:MFS family permease